MGERGRALYRERASKREGKREAKLTATERKRKERRARKKKYGNIDRERMGDRRGAIEEKNRSARREERERERERGKRGRQREKEREREEKRAVTVVMILLFAPLSRSPVYDKIIMLFRRSLACVCLSLLRSASYGRTQKSRAVRSRLYFCEISNLTARGAASPSFLFFSFPSRRSIRYKAK